MPLTDLSLSELERYTPDREEPADLDAFWDRTLTEARTHPMTPRFEPVDAGLRAVEVHDVTFPGFGGDPVKGWLMRPAGERRRLPCLVSYLGYGGGRGLPHERLVYAAAGYANLVMDTRGQGAGWSRGDTPDRCPEPVDPQHPGFMTRGIGSPETYYYRRLVTDAVRAVEAARVAPGVDPDRIAVGGESQGGGLALAAAGLADRVAAALVDVPFLCHWRRALEVATEGPYLELVGYCAVQRHQVATVFTTLSYVDGLNFAVRAGAPALFSVALMDPICPPSTVYAAYHHYAGPKRMVVWPYNQHEGGEAYQQVEHLRFLRDTLAADAPAADAPALGAGSPGS
jgi:cephalosporin-C deacetylase